MSSLLQSTDGAQKKWVDSISTALLHALGNLHVQLFVPAKGTLEKSSSDIQDVARPPFCMPSSHDAKKRQGHSLEEALMVESLGIASTCIFDHHNGSQDSTIDVSWHRSFRFQLFSMSHFLVMQTTSAKHWNRQKQSTTSQNQLQNSHGHSQFF